MGTGSPVTTISGMSCSVLPSQLPLVRGRKAPGIIPNSSAHPADILLPNWSRGRQAALDVSVISPLQQLTLSEAAVTPGHALQVCVRRKLTANLPACRAAGVGFVPVVVEVLGGWSPEASSTIRRIGDALGQRTNPSCPSQTMKHLFGRLAIALWRGNATLWLRRAPALHPSADGCYLVCLFSSFHLFASLC